MTLYSSFSILKNKFWAEGSAIAGHSSTIHCSTCKCIQECTMGKIIFTVPVMTAIWPTSGTYNRLFCDAGQSQQSWRCPGDSGTVGAYAVAHHTCYASYLLYFLLSFLLHYVLVQHTIFAHIRARNTWSSSCLQIVATATTRYLRKYSVSKEDEWEQAVPNKKRCQPSLCMCTLISLYKRWTVSLA